MLVAAVKIRLPVGRYACAGTARRSHHGRCAGIGSTCYCTAHELLDTSACVETLGHATLHAACAGKQTPETHCDSLRRITEACPRVHHLQGLELDGHKLLIQLSQRKRLADDGGKGGKATAGGKANTTKLVRRCLLNTFFAFCKIPHGYSIHGAGCLGCQSKAFDAAAIAARVDRMQKFQDVSPSTASQFKPYTSCNLAILGPANRAGGSQCGV
jgi:hypothetical protein